MPPDPGPSAVETGLLVSPVSPKGIWPAETSWITDDTYGDKIQKVSPKVNFSYGASSAVSVA